MNWKLFLIGYLAASGLVVVARGATGYTRKYGPLDAVLTPIEIGLLIWLVVSL